MVLVAVHTDTVRERAVFQKCLAGVSADRRERVMAAAQPDERCRRLCAGLALDACLHTVGLREAEEPLKRGANGKPRLAAHPTLEFNLSHSGEWAVCVLARSPVGVDIQQLRNEDTRALAARYFTAAERAWMESLPTTERQTAFFRLWAAKESVLKAQGDGLRGLRAVPITGGDILCPPSPWQLREYPMDGYILMVCSTQPFAETVSVISSADSVLLR